MAIWQWQNNDAHCRNLHFISYLDRFVGGETTLQDFMDKAKDVCSTVDTAEPFMCFDLIYIITLLQDGYDLQPTTKLIVGFHPSSYAI